MMLIGRHVWTTALVLATLVRVYCASNVIYDIEMDSAADVATNCTYDNDIYTCEDVPGFIPSNVTAVDVTGYKGHKLTGDLFKHASWKHVTRLQFTGENVLNITNNAFPGIPLTELMLKLSEVLTIDERSFAGLVDLEKLDLIDMIYVNTSEMLNAITAHKVVFKLKYFTFNPGTRDHAPLLKFTPDVVKTLFEAVPSLNSLNLSNTGIQFLGAKEALLAILSHNVTVLNVSGCIVTPTEISDVGMLKYGTRHFESVDWSRIQYTLSIIHANQRQTYSRDRHEIILNKVLLLAENLYSSYIYKQDSVIEQSRNFTDSILFWKSLHFRGNNLVYANCSWTFSDNNSFTFIDLSENKIEYISPSFLTSFIHLETVRMARNQLFKMQHKPEFCDMLTSLRELKILDISFNSLSFLPMDMFSTNDRLEVLNLGSNQFTTVTFSLVNLRSLKLLDLHNNSIANIESDEQTRLSAFVRQRVNTTETFGLKLNLDGNPIVCACRSSELIELLEYITTLNESLNRYSCVYEGEKTFAVNSEAVRKSKYLCIKSLVTTLSAVLSVIVFVIFVSIAIVVARMYKRRKADNAMDAFIHKFRDRQLKETHLLFLAFSSNDEELVENHLLSALDETLRARLGSSDERVVSTGADFLPGHHITEEIHRCLSTSCVLVAVVSDSFCQSRFCEAEIREAGSQAKPVILLFHQEVDQDRMSPYLREIFNRTARAKVTLTENGEALFEPSLEKICESIMHLAVKHCEP